MNGPWTAIPNVQIKLWGVRGSLPTPMATDEFQAKLLRILEKEQERIKDPATELDNLITGLPVEMGAVIGGDTTCVEVSHEDTQLILDMGTGARRLGEEMMRGPKRNRINVLFTHTHWDHIQGWPYFAPGHLPGVEVHFYSCLENLEERLVHQQKPQYHPVGFMDSPSKKVFHYVPPGESIEIGPFSITTQPLLHPGGSISYKIQAEERTFIFATDTEFYGPDLSNLIQEYHKFFHQADLMVMDAQYSLTEAEQKKGWGHTAMTIAVDCCIHWGIKRLILTHHEPAHSDEKIYELYDKASTYLHEASSRDYELDIYVAREGDKYRV